MTTQQTGGRPGLAGPPRDDAERTEAELLAADMPTGFRRDIEGLRALAVLVVLLYHAHIGPLSGGFLGVDVFFVLSGYLITSLLMKDLLLRGTKALPRFWGRRARRLLPASLLVMVVTIIAARFMLDPLKQVELGHTALWASAFIVNIKFAMGDSYAVAQTTPTPLLHFWSLAVEEQFYMVWPFLLYAFTRVGRRIRAYALFIMGVLFIQSLLAFVWFSPWAHTPTFFLLPSRAWELLAGAALALTASYYKRIPLNVRNAGAWLGLVAIAYSVFKYDDTMNLGYAALLPVLGTVAVVGAAGRGNLNEPAAWLGIRPMVWVGQRSYGIYLWHWPALVLLDAKYGPLSAPTRILVLAGSVGMAALSYRFVENPVRGSKWLATIPRRSLALGGALVVTGLFASIVMINLPNDLSGGGAAAAPTLPGDTGTTVHSTTPVGSTPGTAGPTTSVSAVLPVVPLAQLEAAQHAALDQSAGITAVPSNATPSVTGALGDKASIYSDGCVLQDGTTQIKSCIYGDPTSSITVALFGDSHAAQWFPALQKVATDRHWRLEVLVKSGCPSADVRIKRRFLDPECVTWRKNVSAQLAIDHPQLLIVSSTFYDPGGSDVGVDPDTAWRRGLTATLDMLRPNVGKLLLFGDTPLPAHEVPNCLASNPRGVRNCIAQRARAVDTSRLQVEREVAAAHNGTLQSTSDWLCGTSECPVIEGNIIMYRDNNHISATMSKFLAPLVESAVAPVLQG